MRKKLEQGEKGGENLGGQIYNLKHGGQDLIEKVLLEKRIEGIVEASSAYIWGHYSKQKKLPIESCCVWGTKRNSEQGDRNR